jgi:type IV pilus assembly protein PilB
MSAVAPATSSTREYKGRLIGRILSKMGKVNRKQVHEALAVQKTNRGPLGRILVDMGYIKESDLQVALAAQIGMEPVNLDTIDVNPETVKLAEPDG